jgi:ADP-ribosyl-[dinitrogen reductase] hydrolase
MVAFWGRRTKSEEKTAMNRDGSSFALAIVGTGRARGQIAISCCPGRAYATPLPSYAARLLERDVATIARWGAEAAVSLLDELELARLRVKALPNLLADSRVAWHQVPLHPQQLPDPAFEHAWRSLAPQLIRILWRGGRIAVHCLDGKARAGVVAARLLVEAGCAPHDAINRVRAARQGALESLEQEEYVRAQSFLGRPGDEPGLLERDDLVEPDLESAAVEHISRRISAGS